jgi:hypothetical protein
MLRANVGLSRKVSRDYQSTGYSVNLDGEIATGPDDSEAVLERVHELFNVAEEALAREIDRDQSESAIGRRDEDPPAPAGTAKNGTGNSSVPPPTQSTNEPPKKGNNNGSQPGSGDAATNKQVQFILTMGQRFKLAGPKLDGGNRRKGSPDHGRR